MLKMKQKTNVNNEAKKTDFAIALLVKLKGTTIIVSHFGCTNIICVNYITLIL